MGLVGRARGRLVHSCSRGFIAASQGLIEFIWVSVGSLVHALVSSGSLGFAWDHSGAPRCRRVDSMSHGFTPACLGVVAFILVRVGSLGRALGSSCSLDVA